MAIHCFSPDCKHNNRRDTCKFFRFPKDVAQQDKWKKVVGRSDKEPGPNSYLCSCHFRDGEKRNGPELYPRNITTLFQWSNIPNKIVIRRQGISQSTHQIPPFKLDVGTVPEMDEGNLGVAERPGSDSNVAEPLESNVGLPRSSGAILNVEDLRESVEAQVIPEIRFVGRPGSSAETQSMEVEEAEPSGFIKMLSVGIEQSQEEVPEFSIPEPESKRCKVEECSSVVVEAEHYFLGNELEETKEKLERLSDTFSFEHVEDTTKWGYFEQVG